MATEKIDKAKADELLVRFQGGPGVTQGLDHEESMQLFQYLIDSGEVYEMTDGTEYHVAAWAGEGHLTGFDKTKMKEPLVGF